MTLGNNDSGRPEVVVEENLQMLTRDGVMLEADVFRPDVGGRLPTMVMRTPYARRIRGQIKPNPEVQHYVAHGYVVVSQDTRGRGRSGGTYRPFFDEGVDTYDTVEWAAALPWSDGNVGLVGQSYLAATQYFAAPLRPPHLRAMSPMTGAANHFINSVYRRGVFELGYRLPYFLAMERVGYHRAGRYRDERDRLDSYVTDPSDPLSMLTDEAYRHLPISDWGERLHGETQWVADILHHSTYDSFWQDNEPLRRATDVVTPTLHIGSWYDYFLDDTLSMFRAFRTEPSSEDVRRAQHLLLGPGAHGSFGTLSSDGAGAIDLGEAAAVELRQRQLRWFEQFVKGIETGLLEEPPVRLFVMGRNQWHEEDEWPLARTRYTEFYLHGEGRPQGAEATGSLSFDHPGDEPPDGFVYDPEDPAPTTGGPLIGPGGGIRDQRELQRREDVLVYTGETLEVDLEVTGPVRMVLYAASSGPDTDFTAKLVDVHPNGFVQNIVEGIVRARFRESLASPSPIVPGQVYSFPIDLLATSHVFLAGHRIGVQVSSSNFPRYDRNANSGLAFGSDRVLHKARQVVFHDGSRPSHVVLPIVP